MRVIKTSTLVQFPKTIEGGAAEILCEQPYTIERVQEGDCIIWFGYNTNWKFKNGFWTMLIDGDWVLCEAPEYEIQFKNA